MSLANYYNTDYKLEDVDFYREQERKLHIIANIIKDKGYFVELYTPPGGWRNKIDDERKQKPYPNQLYAAYRLFYELFCKENPCVYAYVSADFQGGKSGMVQAFTRLSLTNADKLLNRYGTYFITAMNDIALKNQMVNRMLKEYENQIFHLGTFPKLINEIEQNIDENGFAKNILIIDDESRSASNTNNLKGRLIDTIKNSSPFETWRERNIRLISIDATDPASSINSIKLKNEHGSACNINLQLPPSYLSLTKLKEQSRLHESKDLKIKNNVNELYEQIENMYNREVLWHIIRMPPTNKDGYNKAFKHIKEIFEPNYDIIIWDSKIKQYTGDENYDEEKSRDINDELKLPPKGNKPATILIKNMFYAGKTLNDKYIGALYDRSSDNDDTTGQSFPGRCCGHNRSNKTHVWTNLKGIDRLINNWKDIINQDFEILPSQALSNITSAMNGRMPHIETFRTPGITGIQIQTSGKEITRPENLQNSEVINLPRRLKAEHMGTTIGPCNTREEAINSLNLLYNKKFRSVLNPIDGYFINSRLLAWYKNKYHISKTIDFTKEHILTQEEYETIPKTFSCSSKSGQPYVIYPVYPNKNSHASEVKWYIRYIKKEFTRYNNNTNV
jgi:hypothetical protein